MFNLIPPWAQAIIVVAILGSVGWYGHHKGWESRDNQARLESAAVLAADIKLANIQTEKTQHREAAYEAEIRRLNSIPAKVVHDRINTYVSSLCDTTGGKLPAVSEPQGSGIDHGQTEADAAIRRTDLYANITAAQLNKAQLLECSGWIVDHGFGTAP